LTELIEIDFNEVFESITAILQKEIVYKKDFDESQQVCGLTPYYYHAAINFAKFQCFKVLPKVFQQFGNICLPFVTKTLPQVLKKMSKDLPQDYNGQHNLRGNFNKVLDLIKFSECLIDNFGLNALDATNTILF